MAEEKTEKRQKKIKPELPAKKLQRKIRRAIYAGIILAFVWFMVQFGVHKLDPAYDAAEGKFPVGTSLLFDRFFDYHGAGCVPSCNTPNANIVRNSYVLYRYRTGVGKITLLSYVVGMPGDAIEISTVDNRKTVSIPDHHSPIILRGDFSLPDGGVIPARKFFVLNFNRESTYPDSRDFGLIDADDVAGKVIGPVGGCNAAR